MTNYRISFYWEHKKCLVYNISCLSTKNKTKSHKRRDLFTLKLLLRLKGKSAYPRKKLQQDKRLYLLLSLMLFLFFHFCLREGKVESYKLGQDYENGIYLLRLALPHMELMGTVNTLIPNLLVLVSLKSNSNTKHQFGAANASNACFNPDATLVLWIVLPCINSGAAYSCTIPPPPPLLFNLVNL